MTILALRVSLFHAAARHDPFEHRALADQEDGAQGFYVGDAICDRMYAIPSIDWLPFVDMAPIFEAFEPCRSLEICGAVNFQMRWSCDGSFLPLGIYVGSVEVA